MRTITGALAVIAADQVEREYGLWRADREDVENISAPAARLLYRRLPDEAKGGDALDLFGVALAVAGYVAKHLRLKAGLSQVRALHQQQADEPAAAAPAGP